MSKQDILEQINNCRTKLSNNQTELKKLEEKLCTLNSFSEQCNIYSNKFDQSMEKKRYRLSDISDILGRVKAAAVYSEKANQMLTGYEYSVTSSHIEELKSTISSERRKIENDIDEIKYQINILQNQIDSLVYEYNHYPEEEA